MRFLIKIRPLTIWIFVDKHAIQYISHGAAMRQIVIFISLILNISCNPRGDNQKFQLASQGIHSQNIMSIESFFGHKIKEYEEPYDPAQMDVQAILGQVKGILKIALKNGLKVPNECLRNKILSGSASVAFIPDQIWTKGQLSAVAWDESYDSYTFGPGNTPTKSRLNYKRTILFPADHPYSGYVMSILLIHEMYHQCQMEMVPDNQLREAQKRYYMTEDAYVLEELPAWQLENSFFKILVEKRVSVNNVFLRDDINALPQIIIHYQMNSEMLERELRLTYRERKFE